jgi:RNA methyltransferase, TrmH family
VVEATYLDTFAHYRKLKALFMLSKNKTKLLNALLQKKQRLQQGLFVVEGEKIAHEILTSKSIEIVEIYALESWQMQQERLLRPFKTQIITVTEADLKQISSLTTPNKVLILAKIPPPQYEVEKINNSLSLYLDGIQDPGNMGTILRIADWFSIPYVFCSPTCVDVWNPKVLQATMGAFLRVQSFEIDFVDVKNRFPELPVFVAVLRGDNVFGKNKKFPSKGLVVIGNEGNGVSDDIVAQSDFKITIPGGKTGAESLNAAVSTGIIIAQLLNR